MSVLIGTIIFTMNKRGRHTSVCKAAERSLRRLEASPVVTGIKIGATYNRPSRYAAGHLKFQRYVDAGIRIHCFHTNGIAVVYLYCSKADREAVRKMLDS
jgi:hypothetical protein